MTDFLAPMNYNRARDVLSGLSVYQFYNATDAEKAVKLLRNSYPMIFSKLQEKTFGNHAILLETQGGSRNDPLVLLCHVDAPACPFEQDAESSAIRLPLSRAHLIALFEALEALLYDGFVPSGDLILCLSMDSLTEARGIQEIAEYLRMRSVHPCFVLDWGGYVSEESFTTYLRKTTIGTQPPIALVGITEKGRLEGKVVPQNDASEPIRSLLQAGAKIAAHQHQAKLCSATRQMLVSIATHSRLLRRWSIAYPSAAFSLIALRWRNRTVYHQFLSRDGHVFDVSVNGSIAAPPTEAALHFSQELLPGETCAHYQRKLGHQLRHVEVQYPISFDASACSTVKSESWDALTTAIQIQFEHALVTPCLSPYPTDARFFRDLCDTVYRFSPYLLTDRETSQGTCLLTDDHLQTAVQFFRSMLSV